jgi:transposase-like protein
MNLKHFQNTARQSYWAVHMEAWRQSGLARTAYRHHHRLNRRTFDRWMNYLLGKESAAKHAKYLGELRREQRREKQEKALRKRNQNRYGVSTDVRDRALQAFWAMHVEAMNWSGLGVREYAVSMYLSATSLRIWRDRLADGEVEIDWRAHLHPSARPPISTSAKDSTKDCAAESSLTAKLNADLPSSERQGRRSFDTAEKLAIVRETEQPRETVSSVARRHGIVASMVFRWRAELGFGKGKRVKLASVVIADRGAGASSTPVVLRDLLQPPDGMTAVNLKDGRRVFAPEGSDLDAVLAHIRARESAP